MAKKTNAENQAAYKAKRQAAGYVAGTFWFEKRLLLKVKKLAILNSLTNGEQLNLLLEKGLERELKDT